ncbi:AMP-dependent synthetase and ligase [Candidatus Koribacter versatilis Ellin345]|uniref:AMP-dependent synthetase and ligase n=1 Tax=Koribacter versatilis (strain Ellin345) TaxID=204669 RepID=Q1IJ98_KORVE|nr:acyl-[ACP]--phospholipid O-acyltransferase [Candidatus Koribacter versatilis]ABF43052.1 AMP-dependent synthetase and ligase [Candidatus Koribacter versatilis Ellin345]
MSEGTVATPSAPEQVPPPVNEAPRPVAKNWRGGFWALILTQFQGAFNENGLKNLVVFLVLASVADKAQRDKLVLVVGTLFSLPFILFSMTGGFFADRFSKRTVTIGTKLLEMGVMGLAIAGLGMQNLHVQMAAVFLASTQAALFGPSKYGLLPELLPEEKLSWGNGVLELGTFLAVIAGGVIGATFAEVFKGRQAYSGAILLGLSLLGLFFSLGIAKVAPANPTKKFKANPLADLWSQGKLIRGDRVLWLAIFGNTYFWFLGALLTANIVFYGEDVLHANSTRTGILQAAVAIGIGVGSLTAGYLSSGKIEYGLIPMGSVGMTVFGVLLSRPGLSFNHVLGLLVALGFFAGFFAVPVNALIQHRPDDKDKGGVIAAANLLSFVGIGAATGVYYVFQHYVHFSPPQIFFSVSLVTVAATVYVLFLLPDALLRLILWMLTHTLYRIHLEGRENVPSKGGAVLAPNHVSMVDAILLWAAIDRPIRFLMFKDNYEHPLIKPFAKIMGIIPISSSQRPREMIHSLRTATQALKDGEIIGIFPEGQMTRIGQMLPFKRGIERIVKGVEVPIIPVNLGGVWGSIFSFDKGRFLWKFPRKIPYPVTVTFGKPMPSTSTAREVRQAVQELGADAYGFRKRYMHTLHRSFIKTARMHPMRFAMADGRTPKLRFGGALTKAIFLARRLRGTWKDQEMVGILLPPSVPGALVNLAALMMGKVPVNLNYTASSAVLQSCAEQCKLKTVVTSKAFLERVHVEPPGKVILLEELAEAPRASEKLTALLITWLLPKRLIEKACGCGRTPTLDDTATVIFSSGSTGDPKGVVLSHYNIASNVEQMNQVFMLSSHDKILGILPFFHSFGFTGTLALPAKVGMGVVFHPNPLEARAIGALVSQYSVTFLLATPTFLNAYMRRIAPEDFGSLHYVMTGAEKLPERVSVAFEDTFGIKPLEGYGCTECSPTVTVNTRDFRAAQFRQVGFKRASIGHPLPGISLRVVNPETMLPAAPGEPGLLLVRGPNVMQGYLGRPQKTAEVLHDGWYNTGDIAAIDDDGFVKITDRLSRFSKIGGEMVPHIRVEDKLQEIIGATEQVFAVTAVPDEKKGERLVVLHTLKDEQVQECVSQIAKSDLPPLWKVRADQFVHVDALPYLGTGKLDLRRLREIALGTTV